MKLLKSKEEKELSKAKLEAEKQQKIIAEIEQKSKDRQAMIDKANRDYERQVQIYNENCQMFAINHTPWERFIAMLNNGLKVGDIYMHVHEGMRHYDLDALRDFINATCPEGKKPPVKPIIKEIEE